MFRNGNVGNQLVESWHVPDGVKMTFQAHNRKSLEDPPKEKV